MIDELLHAWFHDLAWPYLLVGFLLSIVVLGYSADKLVDFAVKLSARTGIPRVVVGATIVSLGTTMPEAAVSVFAAVKGQPELALGNAVGSIICDTGLILGLACILLPLPIDRRIVNRQGWIQFGTGLLLVLACVNWSDPLNSFADDGGGVLSQQTGWVFVVLLIGYLAWSMKITQGSEMPEEDEEDLSETRPAWLITSLILVSSLALVASSMVLVEVTKESARQLNVPAGIIAATVVAFGTSLPELVTAMTAVKKQKGEIAVGNVIGADILNVLFVAGASASVTSEGLVAGPYFFRLQFPIMLAALVIFRIGIATARDGKLSRSIGFLLLGVYLTYLVLNLVMNASS